jgi:hypothetical protein
MGAIPDYGSKIQQPEVALKDKRLEELQGGRTSLSDIKPTPPPRTRSTFNGRSSSPPGTLDPMSQSDLPTHELEEQQPQQPYTPQKPQKPQPPIPVRSRDGRSRASVIGVRPNDQSQNSISSSPSPLSSTMKDILIKQTDPDDGGELKGSISSSGEPASD